MGVLKRISRRIRNFATGHRGDDRLREEIEQHVAMQVEVNLRAMDQIIHPAKASVLSLFLPPFAIHAFSYL